MHYPEYGVVGSSNPPLMIAYDGSKLDNDVYNKRDPIVFSAVFLLSMSVFSDYVFKEAICYFTRRIFLVLTAYTAAIRMIAGIQRAAMTDMVK